MAVNLISRRKLDKPEIFVHRKHFGVQRNIKLPYKSYNNLIWFQPESCWTCLYIHASEKQMEYGFLKPTASAFDHVCQAICIMPPLPYFCRIILNCPKLLNKYMWCQYFSSFFKIILFFLPCRPSVQRLSGSNWDMLASQPCGTADSASLPWVFLWSAI